MGKFKNSKILLGVAVATLALAWYVSGTGPFDRDDRVDSRQLIESGVALFNEKNFSGAIETLESVPPGSEREWYARYYQGSAYLMLKDYASASRYLEQSLALDPTNTKIMHALGVAYYKMGNLKLSKAYFASILEIEPGNEEARGLMDIMAKLERNQSDVIAAPGEEQNNPDQPVDAQ